MAELLVKLPQYLGGLLEVLGGLVLIASAIVRFTPSLKDDEYLAKGEGFLYKIMAWLPTLGINPNTKKMKELLEKMGGK